MEDLELLTTELRNSHTDQLDAMPISEALKIMNDEDANVALAVRKQLPQIEKIIQAVIGSFRQGGRLIYVGAGTSGRLGMLDAAECPPTFGSTPGQVIGLLAGGHEAFVKSIENAEDREDMGEADLKAIAPSEKDIIIGVAASGRTPYVVGALRYASKIGAATASVACTENSLIGSIADMPVEVVPGPEVLTGSTRLKAGTAQKMVLNMISTLAMVGIGKVYQNLMVDVQATNQKLRIRAENIVIAATGITREVAGQALQFAGGSVKTAIVMVLLQVSAGEAARLLTAHEGHIREALGDEGRERQSCQF